MILFYDIFWERQIQKQIFCQEKIKWIQRKTIRMLNCSKKNYGQGELQQK